MDNNPQSAKPMSDDQELAKVLAGINQQTEQAMQFGTTPVPAPAPASVSGPVLHTPDPAPQSDEGQAPAADEHTDTEPASSLAEAPEVSVEPIPTPTVVDESPVSTPVAPAPSSTDLTSIKNDALNDLRPLVDKLDIAPEEKFDTYLLLIRSTDDKSLIAPAYAAAQTIADEARKAQALLDVIKEIDYLSKPE